jgi:hypothetical protein
MGYSQYPMQGPMQGLTGAMQQMNIGGPARRDSFGNSAPPPINIRPIQQSGPYYIMQTSPPNAPIASSPNQQMFCEFSHPYYCNFLIHNSSSISRRIRHVSEFFNGCSASRSAKSQHEWSASAECSLSSDSNALFASIQ